MTFVVRLSGTQTIREAEGTLQALRDALAAESTVTLDCEAVEEADLSFLQLIIAARKSARNSGKILELASPATGPLLAALDSAGIRPEGDFRFWFEGAA
jgi:anti-anti-sigma regulatory factor